ncbi:MAG: Mur ligase family protein [Lutibacter sp.]|jgi:UDP-N-acetylmuramate: L-alanyl-gamma-D-glutamyl-meso-diaminopimelate ligase|nr:Mur ligase family protein [Lutibacter sp.]
MTVHFIAIGGSAMHNLAIALARKGSLVTGSDDAIFEPSRSRLERAGLLPAEVGWFPDKIGNDLDMVILGMHAKPDNPELLRAQDLGIRILSYPAFLYEQSQHKTRVVIGGSHGKTTITSMILHVLNYHAIPVDYMVGAQLEGFDTMVHLTEENEFIVLEGDEYLSSPIDPRPKFHLYQPNIALISGIAWDHINVFPTPEDYAEQFSLFTQSLTHGGIMVYNAEDAQVREIVDTSEAPIKKYPYTTPKCTVDNGITYLETPEGTLPLEIFGDHNLQNLEGARQVCLHMGVGETDFYQAIASFKGASKRLEQIAAGEHSLVFKDFAHAPSKVRASTAAVKAQYPNRRLIACLELHTYSSLNPVFLQEYRGSLDGADMAVVFYSPEALAIKGMEKLTTEQIKEAFQRDDLKVFTEPEVFEEFLFDNDFNQTVVLLMSSGNYGGLKLDRFQDRV